jgi:hypothetical protein
MQRVTICRFRKESDADGYAKTLSQLTSDSKFIVVFDPPTLKVAEEPKTLQDLNEANKTSSKLVND